MWYLIYWDRFGNVYLKNFKRLSKCTNFIKKHHLQCFRICQQLSIDFGNFVV